MSIVKQVDFFIDGHKLKRIESFKYLGHYVTKDCKLDEVLNITALIQAPPCDIGKLNDSVCNCSYQPDIRQKA